MILPACLSTVLLAAAVLAAPPLADADSPAPSGSAVAPAAPSGAPPPASDLASEGFVLIAVEKGVKVYRREMRPGIEFAAKGNLAASPERVRRVLLDYPN